MTYQEMLDSLGRSSWQTKSAALVAALPTAAPASRVGDAPPVLTDAEMRKPMSMGVFFNGVLPAMAATIKERIDPLERRLAALERKASA